jgi:hypothetical protein
VGKSEKAEKQRSTAGKDKRPVGRIQNPKSTINNQQSTINNHQSLPPFALRLTALPSPLPQSSAAGAIKVSLRDRSP